MCVCCIYYVCLLDDRPCGRLTFPVGVEPDENALCSFVISSCYLVCDVYLREEFTEYTHTHTHTLARALKSCPPGFPPCRILFTSMSFVDFESPSINSSPYLSSDTLQ